MGSLVWRVLAPLSAAFAAIVANKLVAAIWKKSGRDATLDPHDPRTPAVDAVAFAALTALVTSAAQTLAIRKAANYYAKSAGHLPKKMREDDEA